MELRKKLIHLDTLTLSSAAVCKRRIREKLRAAIR